MAEWLAAFPPAPLPNPQDRIQCRKRDESAGLGGKSGVDPPVPFPNTEVKRPSADDTALATGWENRPVPGPAFLPLPYSPGLTGHQRGVEQW